MTDYYTLVLKASPSALPRYPEKVKFSFKDGNRDKFFESLKESISHRYWLNPIVKKQEEEKKVVAIGHGVAGIIRAKEHQTAST